MAKPKKPDETPEAPSVIPPEPPASPPAPPAGPQDSTEEPGAVTEIEPTTGEPAKPAASKDGVPDWAAELRKMAEKTAADVRRVEAEMEKTRTTVNKATRGMFEIGRFPWSKD